MMVRKNRICESLKKKGDKNKGCKQQQQKLDGYVKKMEYGINYRTNERTLTLAMKMGIIDFGR